ncbi:NFACT family protein [Mechercharimyces sp. CAU 1602]|uniref:Rqc2 family fibronectin-binding protein n=1 Tax=Mechercharimyces sp. CAU 1602 TaxID=2973933 RepID=UPI0021621C15|nr:NFACT family protein [Mechercharimyces sp. CAU 1602]MCS1350657.1 NFACT family protein [Mechercharimyces sp. CAU 1602]
MAFDGIVTRAVVHELQSLQRARITKIYQPTEYELLLHLRTQGENKRLLLSAHPAYPRVHFSQNPMAQPKVPPMFCMLLRKYCEGGFIENISQVGLERIIHINIRARNELGDEGYRRIIIELMGRHSNIILVDPESGKILDGIQHVTPSISQYRQVLPGAIYLPPPEQKKENPLLLDQPSFLKRLDFNSGRMDQQLVMQFSGLGPMIAKEIIFRAGLGRPTELWDAFNQVFSDVRAHRYTPNVTTNEKGKQVFSALQLMHQSQQRRTAYDSISTCLEAYYYGKAERDRTRQQSLDLIRKLKNERDKNEKKIRKLQREVQAAAEAGQFRMHGELITAYMHDIKRGDSSYSAINFYDETTPTVTIALDPELSPAENAQRYFKKYNKAKAVRKWNEEQIDKAIADNHYLETVLVQLENASITDIDEIREELHESGFLKTQKKSKKKQVKPEPLTFYSKDGTLILVGKNNKQNDRLTHQIAAATDTWLHTKDIPGSHVVIRTQAVSEDALYTAAMLAAYYSKARNSSQVPVDYTLIKHVRKPSGARPGYVTYEEQKTLYVTPSEETIYQWLKDAHQKKV